MISVLFVRPSYDDVTSYLFYFSKELIDDSKSKGFNTLNKEEGNAKRGIVENIIVKNDPNFIMFNGHGNDIMICGHKNEILVKKGVNESMLKNRITYSLSCSSAKILGKSVADDKTTFIGYTDDFALGMDVNCQTVIHKDKRAKLFLEPSNLLVKSILKGNSPIKAVEKAKELMKSNISKLRTDPFPDARDYIPYLYNNFVSLEAFGEVEAVLGHKS